MYLQEKESVLMQYNKQIEVYTELKNAITLIKDSELLNQFNMKVLNVKFEKAIEELFKENNINISVSVRDTYNNQKRISLYNQNRSYSKKNTNDEYSGWFYVECNTWSVDFDLFQNKRIDKDNIILEITHQEKYIQREIDVLQNTLNQYDVMKEEFLSIYKSMEEFKKKYSYSITNYAGMKFDR